MWVQASPGGVGEDDESVRERGHHDDRHLLRAGGQPADGHRADPPDDAHVHQLLPDGAGRVGLHGAGRHALPHLSVRVLRRLHAARLALRGHLRVPVRPRGADVHHLADRVLHGRALHRRVPPPQGGRHVHHSARPNRHRLGDDHLVHLQHPALVRVPAGRLRAPGDELVVRDIRAHGAGEVAAVQQDLLRLALLHGDVHDPAVLARHPQHLPHPGGQAVNPSAT